MMDDFNKRCAEALGWESHIGTLYSREYLSFKTPLVGWCAVEGMHFHDSYDWAMLLVKKLSWLQMSEYQRKLHYGIEIKTFGYGSGTCPVELFLQSPRNMAKAALEVLEGSN